MTPFVSFDITAELLSSISDWYWHVQFSLQLCPNPLPCLAAESIPLWQFGGSFCGSLKVLLYVVDEA